MPTLETYHGTYLWKYMPGLPAAIVFTVLFTLATIAHGWKMVKTKLWFCLPFVIGGIFEVIGYIFRAVAYTSTGSLIPYIIQAIFLLLPPILFAASMYMVYSRIVRAVQGDRFSPTSPRWTTTIFVLSDCLSLMIQSNASGLLTKPKTVNLGNHIIVGGLAIQVLMFAVFMLYCLTFNIRFRAHVAETDAARDIPWQSSLNMLYLTSVAVLVRNIYRVVEFVMGEDGFLLQTEWPLYVFDGALMFMVMVGFFVWYPDQLQPNARDSMIELMTDGTASVDEGHRAKHSRPTS